MGNLKITVLLFFVLIWNSTAAQIKVTYSKMMGPLPDQASGQEQPRTPIVVFPKDLHPVKSLAEVGISDPLTLYKVDALINNAIQARAFPGCRVLAAKDGRIFYDKAFGFFTYDKT
ncbi:MAG: hypothetical protein JST36_04180, partial [Bacteroidetes bacterium]|nr:hypothetical protein [Bacteroidota bacterium]